MEPHKKQNITKKEHYIHKNYEEEGWGQEGEDCSVTRHLDLSGDFISSPLFGALGLVWSNSIMQRLSLIGRISESWDAKLTWHGK